jgi:hypothetical protein
MAQYPKVWGDCGDEDSNGRSSLDISEFVLKKMKGESLRIEQYLRAQS